MDWKLEVVPMPVTDVDRARDFYKDKVGFHLDHDRQMSEHMRIVQLTPPGSGCSIVMGEGIVNMSPGTLDGLQLVVHDIKAAHAELVERGVEVSDVTEIAPGDGGLFMWFSDPDGNGWAVQQFRGDGS
jgi:predicted enzyme related to lactoylglutathione lyase